VAACPVGGATDCNDAIAAKARRVEIRVVEDVEDFRPELQLALLVKRNVLEDGEVKPVEAGTRNLGNSAQVRRGATSHNGASRRIRECSRIPKPAQLAVAVCVQAQLQGLTRKERAATGSLQAVVYASKCNRLATLQGCNPLHTPPSDESVGHCAGIRHEL